MQKLVVGSTSLMVLLMSSGLLLGAADAAERARPFLIGALTASWGHSPAVTGLRDGLRDLGYREDAQFVLGVRFTQGDLGALPAAARLVVPQGITTPGGLRLGVGTADGLTPLERRICPVALGKTPRDQSSPRKGPSPRRVDPARQTRGR